MSSAELYGRFEKSQTHRRQKQVESVKNSADEFVILFPGSNGQCDSIIIQEDGIFRINDNLMPLRPVFNADFKQLVDSVLKEPSL
ncbi:MAG: hypothetical protein LBU99_00620 [Spirochaetaceae bacterium]|jgi:hypothetical protein|nr:hypothetical protein [Spirochaetaceae bacterium]